MMSLLSLTCVNAQDLNESDLNQGDLQESDASAPAAVDAFAQGNANLEMPEQSSASTTTAVDAFAQGNAELEMSEESGASSPTAGDALSKSKTKSDSKSGSYLILDNDVDIENIYIGDYVIWIVSVMNKGPGTAKNVKVYDQLPDGLKYIRHTATKGTFNPKTGIWSIGNLAVSDGEVFLNITTRAFSAGEKINRANLTCDSYNLNENESYEEEEIDVFEHAVRSYAEKSIVSVNEKSIDSGNAAGNPLALIVLSLLTVLIMSVKTR